MEVGPRRGLKCAESPFLPASAFRTGIWTRPRGYANPCQGSQALFDFSVSTDGDGGCGTDFRLDEAGMKVQGVVRAITPACRNCIGQNFAIVEIKVIVALILLRFQMTVEPTKPLVFMPHIFIKPKKGIYLHLKKLP